MKIVRLTCLTLCLCCWLAACGGKATLRLPTDTVTITQLQKLPTKPATPSVTLGSTTAPGRTATSTFTRVIPTTTPKSTPTLTPTPIPEKPTSTPTIEVLSPQVVQLCPTETKVSLADLGIDNYLMLVEKYFEKNDLERGYIPASSAGVLVVSADNLKPRRLPFKEQPGWTLNGYYATYDGKSIELWYGNKSDNRTALWLGSWDGQKQEKVYEYLYDKYYVQQVGHLLVEFEEIPKWYSYRSVSVEDLTTGETRLMQGLPEIEHPRAYVISDTLYILYTQVNSNAKYMMYDDVSKSSRPAFSWLSDKEWVWSRTTVIFETDGRFSVYVPRPYGFDMAYDLSMDTILQPQNYDEIMKVVRLPGIGDDDPMSVFNGVYELTDGVLFDVGFEKSQKASFYQLNYRKGILTDYCINVNKFHYTEISPDNRFMSITNCYGDHPALEHSLDYPTEIIVLDLQTGLRVRIPDPNFKVDGWGIKP